MDYVLANVVVLCCVNSWFLLLGSLLNVVVLLCFWKSIYLRKKMGYFMIFVLSSFDLAAIIISHPFVILSTAVWYLEQASLLHTLDSLKHGIRFLYALSFYLLLAMTIERYLSIVYPIYHKTTVTKSKMKVLILLLSLFALTLRLLTATGLAPEQMPSTLSFFIILPVLIITNCKMYAIARKATRGRTLQDKRSKLGLKNVSTCILAVVCFTICSLPGMIFNIANMAGGKEAFVEKVFKLCSLWVQTFLTVNSTLNCLIFFWKNEILRQEGKKVLTKFIQSVFNRRIDLP